jgi:hypothetical protein
MLTFDVDDFINDRSTVALNRILELLQKHDLVALFFITGHVAERLENFPTTLDSLESQEIGYHSSSHSVRPTIFEYCDVDDYEKAYKLSLQRENAHINPLTGDVEGPGGISFLRNLFPRKKVVCFRAPGLCWTPPNLEALATLGIKFDFSAFISSKPVFHKGITFYPYPLFLRPNRWLTPKILRNSILRGFTVVTFHSSAFANKISWDSIYYRGNPKRLSGVPSLSNEEKKFALREFETLLKQLRILQGSGLIEIAWRTERASTGMEKGKMDIELCYKKSVEWALTYFNFRPKLIHYQFLKYFRSKIC